MEIAEVKKLWDSIKEELGQSLPEHVFTWINPLEAVDYENNTLVLLSPHALAVDILKKGWLEQIREVVKKQLGADANFSLNFDREMAIKYDENKRKELKKQLAGESEEQRKEKVVKLSLAQMQSSANLNLNLKFDNFVVGDNSRFAYNAAFAVANNPSKKFNPLFIYGSSGLGKTHLLQAIGHYIIFNKPELKVRYVRMEEYCNEWISCFQHQDKNSKGCNNTMMRKFHQKFQNIDVLLMDDIQFIEGRTKTMIEFFSTFEALYTKNKQIVLASDRLPGDIPRLDERLRTRFEMGLVVDIAPPDYETRFEIVKNFAKETIDYEIEDEVFEFIAQNFVSNVRELKGAFNKVSFYAEMFNTGITLETAQKALKGELRKKEITIDVTAEIIAKYYDLTVKDLKSTARQQKISHARHVAIYLSRDMLNLSFESIGDFYNKKHTTVMYSCDIVKDKLKEPNNTVQKEVDELKELIKNS